MARHTESTEDYRFFLKRVGEALARARNARGLSQREIGERIEKSQGIIARVEKFAPLDLSMRSVYEMAQAIPVSMSEIVAEAEGEARLVQLGGDAQHAGERMRLLCDKLQRLDEGSQAWMASVIEALFERTHPGYLSVEPEVQAEALM